jgi:hypothetical protein
MSLEEAWAANQYQLGSLMAAVDRTAPDGSRVVVAEADATRAPVASSRAVSLMPDIPVAYLLTAAMLLCGVFFGGLVLSAASREAKAMAEAKRNAGRWMYRMAS